MFTAARTGVKPVQNFISTVKALGIDQFYQRHRIVVQKKSGPTGDPYFSFDFQYVGEIESMEEAKVLRNLYDSYAKSGFVTDVGGDDDRPAGKVSDFVPDKDDDEDSFRFDDMDLNWIKCARPHVTVTA